MRPPSLSSALFRVGMLSRNLGLNGSATFEPMRQVLTYRLTMFSTDIPVKSFACCIMFMFRLAQVFMTSSHRAYRMLATWGISVVPLLDGQGCLLPWKQMILCEDLVYVTIEGSTNPTFSKPEISISI